MNNMNNNDKKNLELSIDKFVANYNQKLERVYGNCHDTMIGFFVDWWLMQNSNYIAIQNTPGLKYPVERLRKVFSEMEDLKKEISIPDNLEIKTSTCDAFFCNDNEEIVGLLEVEGTKPLYILEKVTEYFLASKGVHKKYNNIDYEKLKFAIVVLYPTGLIGKKDNKYPKGAAQYLNENQSKLKSTLIELNKVIKQNEMNQSLILLNITKSTLSKSKIDGMDSIYYALANSEINYEIISSTDEITDEYFSKLCIKLKLFH